MAAWDLSARLHFQTSGGFGQADDQAHGPGVVGWPFEGKGRVEPIYQGSFASTSQTLKERDAIMMEFLTFCQAFKELNLVFKSSQKLRSTMIDEIISSSQVTRQHIMALLDSPSSLHDTCWIWSGIMCQVSVCCLNRSNHVFCLC